MVEVQHGLPGTATATAGGQVHRGDYMREDMGGYGLHLGTDITGVLGKWGRGGKARGGEARRGEGRGGEGRKGKRGREGWGGEGRGGEGRGGERGMGRGGEGREGDEGGMRGKKGEGVWVGRGREG